MMCIGFNEPNFICIKNTLAEIHHLCFKKKIFSQVLIDRFNFKGGTVSGASLSSDFQYSSKISTSIFNDLRMKNFTLLSILFFFTTGTFGQTPCGTISPLDCDQVEVSLPVNLDFNGSVGGILSTGFTMVDPPSSRLAADDAGADPDVPGLLGGNLSLLGSALNVTATKGINFRQPTGGLASGNTNSQMNALGVGFVATSNIINIEATLAQPNFDTSSPDNRAQQAGIWVGLNENNFVKLVAVNRNGTNQSFQLAVEQSVGAIPGANQNLTIEELNTADNISASGATITLRLSIDPSTNSVTGFYSLDGATEVQVIGATNALIMPASFLAGVDHDNSTITQALTYAGIMTSTRNSTGGSLEIAYENFSVIEDIPVPPATVTAPYRVNVAGSDYTFNGDLFQVEDISYVVGTSTTSTNPYAVVGGNGDLYIPRRFGADFGYAFPIANGTYTVALHMVENFRTAPNTRVFDVIIEDDVVIDDIDLFVTAGEKTPYIESFDVTVSDGELNIDFLATVDGGIVMAIEILPVTLSDATEILTFAITGETAPASIDTGAGTISIEVENGTGLTGLVPTITLSNGATIAPLSGVTQDFEAGVVTYTVTAEDGNTTQDYAVTVTEALPPLSMETDITVFALASQTGGATIDTDAGTIAIEVANGTNFTILSPTITLSVGASIDPLEGSNTDLDDGSATYTVTAEDGFTTKVYTVTVTEALAPFSAFINFQNNPSFTTQPTGYLADYGKAFGNAAVTVNSTAYDFGWKRLSDNSPIDISNEASNNGGTGPTGGAGRNRITGTYSGASNQEKLEGTLIHFQGDNIISNTGGNQSWSGQPRGNEVIWELEIPNGTYEVTIGLGDKDVNNLDSRHSATLEGLTVIPAFVPAPGQTKVETMVVEVTDGFLTMNGFGGFNSKITHIDIVESEATPVNGVLGFTQNTISESLEAGTLGSFSSILSGSGATDIGLIINDNINAVDKTITGANDWLSLPTTDVPGEFTFAIDATALNVGDTRSNTIIATAKGFVPAILDADLTVIEAPIVFVSAPFRMNVAGAEYTKDADLYQEEDVSYLVETQPSTVSNTSYTPYTVPGGHEDLYYPRRYGPEFGYNFPIANGTYTVAVHMVENFHEVANARIFDVSFEGDVLIDNLDLFATYGKGGLAILSFDVEVTDEELNIDFLASVNNGIVQAIEILPVALSDAKDILTFAINGIDGTIESTGTSTGTIALEVLNEADLAALTPAITVSDLAGIAPETGVENDFTNPVDYVVTAEDGSIKTWTVTVTKEAPPVNVPPVITANQVFSIGESSALNSVVGTVEAIDEDALTYTILAGNEAGIFTIDESTGELTIVQLVDYAAAQQYTLSIEVDDLVNPLVSEDITIDVLDTICNPLSSLPCDEIAVSVLPLNLDFTTANGNLSQSGLTMALAPSARLATDDSNIPDERIPGYAPGLIRQDASGLTMTSTKGIFFSQLQTIGRTPNSANTNSQINALGVGLTAPASNFSVSTTLVVPDFSTSIGNSAQQAGLWYGLDEDRYIKLVLSKINATTQRVQLQVENLTDNPGSIVEVNLDGLTLTPGDDLTLRMAIDSQTNTVQGYYSVNGAAEVLVTNGTSDAIAVPAFYFEGISYSEASPAELLSFAGIFTTHRNAAVNQSIDFLFKDFAIEENDATLPPVVLAQSFDISEAAATGDVVGTVEATDADTDVADLTFAITAGNDAGAFAIDAASGEITTSTLLDFSATPQYTLTVEVTDGENVVSATMTINVEEDIIVPPTGDFAFIEDFDAYTPSAGDLVTLSNGDWVKQSGDEGLQGIPVLEEGLTPNTTHSLEINSATAIAVHDFQKLIDTPTSLEANIPFYYGTYFKVTQLGASDGNRIRVAIRIDDESGEAGAGWVRHIIGNYGGTYFARLGLAGSNSNNGQTAIDPDQLLQFVVKGVWDGASTITYQYTIAPTLAEVDNTWIDASAPQTVSGTPELARIFISSTSTANNGKIGPIRLSTDYAEVVTEEITEEASPCSPFSTLPCDQIVTSSTVDLSFNGTEGGLSDTGFTMVDPYSATRVTEDGTPSNTDVPGYEPGNLSLIGGNLVITANKGIAYLDNNAQINTLGVGLQDLGAPITIETKLLGITTGGSAAQAGIWFGIDDENFVKLNVNDNNIEMRREIGGLSANGADSPDQIQVAAGAAGQDVTLRLVLDPIAQTLTAFYSINDGSFVQLTKTNFDNLALPIAYLTGKEINPEIGNASFAGVYATHRNNANSFDATFDYFKVSGEASLSFDVAELIFSGEVGEIIAPQTANLSASEGNPTIVLSDDPASASWLILPENPVLGDIEFDIQEGLAAGNYSTTIFAIDQPDLGYVNAEITISLEIAEPVNNFAVNINFSDPATAPPTNYERDSGDPYGDRGNGLNYGWLDAVSDAPADLTLNGRNRGVGVTLLENTLVHMQYGDVSTNAANGYLPDAKWEIEVPNGSYLITVFVGDPNVDGSVEDTPRHRINAEGVNIIDDFSPTGLAGTSTRFTSGSATVLVNDGRLTLDPSGFNGFNTKIGSVRIVASTGGVQTPRVVSVIPADGAMGVAVNTSISANDLFLPNLDAIGNAGVDNTTISINTVKLIKVENGNEVSATVNGTAGGDAINLVPSAPLEANTQYRFEINGVLDLVGESFEAFTSSFTTGSGSTGPVTDLDNVSFTNAGTVATGAKYSTLTIGPDGKLYGLQINGDIDRWNIENDGTLSGKEELDTWKGNYGNDRTSVGLAFDPDATAQNLIAYISHNSGGLNGAPAWDGKISRLTGANLETEALIVTNLPRSTKDHLTNSITFRPGENNVLYFNQGSNSAAGAPDGSWGNRKERLLSAAALRLDLDKLPEGQWPLNAKTTMDLATINAVDVNSPILASPNGTTYSESGQNGISDDGTYNPYYVDAPLTLFGTGVRNAYDLVWHSNGQLYIPTNGTAGGSNAPASIDGTRRPDGSFYEYSNSTLFPIIPASNGNNTQRDWLFRLDPANPLGYFGHPNPLRGEFVLNRGDADVNNSVYNGVVADINYRGDAFDFEFNKSPNGVIEYKSNAENGNLTGALLVVRYSGSSDIIALVPDGPNGDIDTFKEGIPGFTGFQDPLDLVEDVSTGNIYVSDYGRSEIVLLRPSAQAAPEALIVLDTEQVVGDAVTSSDYIQEILLSNLGNATLEGISASITGPDSNQFFFNGLVSSLNAQNSSAFNVVFTPTSTGPKFAQLTISGTGVEDVIIPLNGLGKQGTGGANEPSLQWILDTQLGSGVVNVGDEDPTTNIFNPASGLNFNNLLGDELDIQSFERAVDAPVTLEVLSVYGPTANNPIVAYGWYGTGNATTTNELFTIGNLPTSNGQRLDPPLTGLNQFDPGTQSFGFYSRWPFFDDRQLFSEDALNTFTGAIPHHVRVYAMPGETDAYIIATEEHISGFDYQDIVVIARNIRPAGENPLVACAPISTLDCDEIEVALPFSLDFDGTEGGLSNTGFTMVDNPSARIDVDGPISNVNVPGYEPGQLSISNGNLNITANNGISFVTNGTGAGFSSDVNSQINTLGVGFDAAAYGNFSITTTIVNPYTDATNDSEQAGLWFGLNEDNFVKLIANSGGQIELRSELNGISVNGNQVIATVENLNSSTVKLRLFIDIDNNALVAYYTLNSGLEVELGSLPLPSEYLAGNTSYDNQSFAGIFATKRREETANVVYTFGDFAITPENNPVALVAKRINVGGTAIYTDAQGNDWELDGAFLTGNSEVQFKTFDVAGTAEDPLFLEYRFANDDAGQPGTPFGYSIPVTGTGPYTVKLYFIEPYFGIPGGNGANLGAAGNRVFNVDIEGGQAALSNYDLNAQATPGTLITETFSDISVTDGNLTIDFTSITNNAIISAIEVIGGESISEPFFANVNPDNNATNVAITDFQINVSVVAPEGYELDKTTIAGNVNLYRLFGNEEVLVPANANDTGGGDAITLTPLSGLQPFTTYVFRLTSDVVANRIGDLTDRIPFQSFRSEFTTGDETTIPDLDLSGVAFTPVDLPTTRGERFSSLAIGPDGKLYASTIGDFQSDGQIYRWDMAADGTLENQEILTPALEGSPDPEGGSRPASNNERLIIGFAFDPSATADNLVAYVTHSQASDSDGPEWDGKLTRLSGPTLGEVQDIIEHLPRSKKDHLTNSIIFNGDGDLFINQGSNSAGGAPDASWDFRPERLLSAAVLKLELDKLPNTLPLSAYTTDDIGVINSAPTSSIVMSDNTYNPYAINSPLTIFASGIRNAYDFVWHSNGWLYIPTNGTAGNNSSSPNSPSYTAGDPLARRIDNLTSLPNIPALNGGETQKDWLFKTQGGSYHGHPNPFRGEFILNHGGAPYSGVPGQEVEPKTDVAKYPDNLGPDPNYREPAYDFGFNKSPNGAIEYKSDAFDGRLQGLLMVVRFSGQDDIIVLQPQGNGNIANANGDVPGLQGFDDPLDVVEDPLTGNLYVSEYDRSGNTNVGLVLLRANTPATRGPEIVAAPEELIFEMTVNDEGQNTDTETVEVSNEGNEVLNITGASFTGVFADQYASVSPSGPVTLQPGESETYTVVYAPSLDNSNLGYQEAVLAIESNDPNNIIFEIGLHGLKKAGFEGGQEPFLQDVVDALGIGIDVGWNSLSIGTNAAPQGEELGDQLWIKAGNEPVTLVSVGRYSPAETLPFGWYTNVDGTITTNEVGVQAGGIANAQTLFPILESGDTSFDPQGAVFGIYVESNTFNRINYTEDAINTGGVAHRTRVYPNKDRDGNLIENSYLITFEDATNGDYQDYIYILSNVVPFEDGSLILDFNKESLDFIVSLNQEDIPVQQVILSGTGGVVGSEVTLESTEDWVVLPEIFALNSPFDVGIDNTGLGNGSYTATVTATSPNYEDATFTVNLEITNELVYTYQFNFQTPDDVEISPEGYVDDIGAPYGVKSTSQGNLTYGWVLPGTTTPADAGVNGRNRDSGIQDGVLLQTFTIIGHPTPATFPQYDWLVEVPNGTYSVNISVGERDFSNSNHVLDVNGTEVINFNQDADTEGNFYSEDTKFVEVTDGTLRMSLGTGGFNAKPNYIRLAPLNTSLLPPTILATFDGNNSDADTYRGPVDITLEARDESDSGSIIRLEYNLDDSGVEAYTAPITVSEVGAHVLEVTAEDGNGNTTIEIFSFTIETPTGALLAIENMTKVPGTDRGFPADDYYTFHRLGNPGQALVHDSNVMRLNNTGTGELIITNAILSDSNDYTYEVLDETGTSAVLPIVIAPGSFAELDITFVGTTGTGSSGIFVEDIEIVSNADNALENIATLHGAYSPQPEGGDEINAQEVFDAFGFQTSMLSIVNDEGTITPPNNLTFRPSSNYPVAANVDAGYEGDMVLSDNFVQADSSKPVIGIQLSALHGGPSSNGAKFVQTGTNTGTVGGIDFSHNPGYYQTLLPKAQGSNTVINNDSNNGISGSFRIAVANYLSSGGNNINGSRPDLLGLRIYKVIDHKGNIVPNEYIVLQDFVQGGCGAGSANCDWNDNTFYFINIRPEGVPTATPIGDLLANSNEEFTLDVSENFDSGYPGNTLTYTIRGVEGALPSWIQIDARTGSLTGTPPIDAPISLNLFVEASDTNGLVASTPMSVLINVAPIAQDDAVTVVQNIASSLEGLLENDSEPNGQTFSISSVETPLNGSATIQEGGLAITYTPNLNFIGDDSFTYVIEDATGLTATANVSVTVTSENQAPIVSIVTDVTNGPAALSVNFDGSGSTDDQNAIVAYEWDFGDGSILSNEAIVNHVYTSAGSYNATLRVTDAEGLSGSAAIQIVVTSPPNSDPIAVATATPGAIALQYTFDASGSSDVEGTLSYEWNFGDGTPIVTDQSPVHIYAIDGVYNVTLTVTDEDNATNSTTIIIDTKGFVIGDFALRINAGGPATSFGGNDYIADTNFVGGKVYANGSATVPVLYQTERSALPPAFGYEIPLANGEYRITLHFAENLLGRHGWRTLRNCTAYLRCCHRGSDGAQRFRHQRRGRTADGTDQNI